MEKFKQNPIVRKIGFNRVVLIGVLIAMYIVFCVAIPGFVGLARILDTLNYVYFLGFLSLGVTFVIATGGIDFSIGPVMFCCALISGYCLNMYGVPIGASILISILVGLAFGLFNGYLVAYWSVPAFIVSMASMNIGKGIGIGFDAGSTIKGAIEDGTLLGAVTQSPLMMGYYAIYALTMAANGDDPADVPTEGYWYDASNMNDSEIAPNLYD